MVAKVYRVSVGGDESLAEVIAGVPTDIYAFVADDAAPSTPLSGVAVEFSLGGETVGEISGSSATSDVNGNAIIKYMATAEDVGKNGTVYARTSNQVPAGNVKFTVAGAHKVSKIELDISTIPNDGTLPSTLSAYVVTKDGLPAAAGVEVTFNVTTGWAILGEELLGEPFDALTDEYGIAVAKLYGMNKYTGILVVEAVIKGEAVGESIGVIASVPLPAVDVFNASDEDQWTLDPYDLEYPAVVQIPHYPGAAANDKIRLIWGEVKIEVGISDPGELPINVEVNRPEALHLGIYNVYYEVVESSSNPNVSSARRVRVLNLEDVNPTLERPICEEGEDDSYISIQDASNGVIVTIKYDNMRYGDKVTLYWHPVDKSGVPVAGAEADVVFVVEHSIAVDIKLPLEKFFPDNYGFEGTVDAFYYVVRGSSGGDKIFISHSSHYNIDTVSPGGVATEG